MLQIALRIQIKLQVIHFEVKTVFLTGKKQLTCTYAHVSTFFVFSPLSVWLGEEISGT